ncbi:polymorphic toxin-type HINT domain-containing protein [Streptomyces niveiscabiei]|uniref:Polymorphic toxin-type HINT domain-containing protein n=1 Tax=Streptomyces niveiscabiei TaxID=164115 RepID=A0ABW9I700_9ACTN
MRSPQLHPHDTGPPRRPISTIKAGDKVLATDPQTGITSPEPVRKVIVTHNDHDFTILTLSVAPVRGPPSPGNTSGTPQTLTTTWHHPFWDAGHQRWIDAHDLTPGTKLRQPDSSVVVVTGVRNIHQDGITYDLTVGKLHTYYVRAGAVLVLVYNCGGAAPGQIGQRGVDQLESDLVTQGHGVVGREVHARIPGTRHAKDNYRKYDLLAQKDGCILDDLFTINVVHQDV